jgi:hypothetical protein
MDDFQSPMDRGNHFHLPLNLKKYLLRKKTQNGNDHLQSPWMVELIYAPNRKPPMCIISNDPWIMEIIFNCNDFLFERKEWCGWFVFFRT